MALAAMTQTCTGVSGGLETIWLTDKANVTSFTLTSGEYTAITMNASAVFYKFDFAPGSASRQEVVTQNYKTGAIKITRTLKFTTVGLSKAIRTNLQALINASACGVIAVCKDHNGLMWVDGYNEISKRAMKISTMNVGHGEELDGLAGAEISLMNENTELSLNCTATPAV